MIPTTKKALDQGLIVSVQAPKGSPMRDPQVIAAMAEASLRSGAVGVRLESPERAQVWHVQFGWQRAHGDSPVAVAFVQAVFARDVLYKLSLVKVNVTDKKARGSCRLQWQ